MDNIIFLSCVFLLDSFPSFLLAILPLLPVYGMGSLLDDKDGAQVS